ncbi:hypothetical protein RF11_15164 [Thelohanellus kitauei]|uniref:Uncharacterized protein n=1 Tax=Thelohanellus kitauei TaxID=669202 RepID=A0A0C2MMF1_THEKT|nr:hypothetical protein RF11_15164 [Thelohanellus kitauei]
MSQYKQWAAERVIRTLKSRYRAERNSFEDKCACLKRMLFCLRNSIDVSANRIPSELFLGRKLYTMISNVQLCSRRSMHDAKITQKLYHDRHSRDRDFEIDDQV